MPSVKQFRIALQCNINIRLQKALDTGNCQEDSQEMLDLSEIDAPSSIECSLQNSCSDHVSLGREAVSDGLVFEDSTSTSDGSIKGVTLETCSNVYVAGYFANILIKKTVCDNNCHEFLLKDENALTDEKEIFLLNKNYSSSNSITFLKRPSDHFLNITETLMNKFITVFEELKTNLNIFKAIFSILLDEIDINSINLCPLHIERFVKLLTKTFLYKEIKWETEKFNKMKRIESANKPHRKLRILSNK